MSTQDLATAADVARKLLAFYGGDASRWTQGAFARNRSGEDVHPAHPAATCWCEMGARDALRIPRAARIAYYNMWITQFQWRPVAFNDAPGRTFAEVVAMLERIAALSPAGEP